MPSVYSFCIAIGAVAGCVPLAFADGVRDACRARIPESLVVAAAKKFPSFDLPLVADNLPEDIAYNIKNGGSRSGEGWAARRQLPQAPTTRPRRKRSYLNIFFGYIVSIQITPSNWKNRHLR
jgi:hypothetical protein